MAVELRIRKTKQRVGEKRVGEWGGGRGYGRGQGGQREHNSAESQRVRKKKQRDGVRTTATAPNL